MNQALKMTIKWNNCDQQLYAYGNQPLTVQFQSRNFWNA